jgi:SAM-dependent methyltransferase
MMTDSRTRFAAAAEHYDQHRPSYPAELIDWIIATTGVRPPAPIADIGCGTGIATRLLAARGFDTVGVEPSEEMLAVAREAGGGARYVRGEAAATTLPDASVDLVTAAQCFHWFAIAPTLRELRRVLRPGGWCSAFWNLRAPVPFMDGYYDLIHRFSSEYEVLERQELAPDALRVAKGVASRREAQFANRQTLDHAGLLGRAYSSSCVTLGVKDKPAFERSLSQLFSEHEVGGTIELQYRTVALCWTIENP